MFTEKDLGREWQKERCRHHHRLVPWLLHNLLLTPFLLVDLGMWDAAGKGSWGSNEKGEILTEGKGLGDGRAKSLERGIMGNVLHEKVPCVPALGIRTDGCQAHCNPKAAVLV